MTKMRVTYEIEPISFEDIRAGDMIETKHKTDGVLEIYRGTAFELRTDNDFPGQAWYVMEGEMLVAAEYGQGWPIYRITPISAEEV